MNNKQNAYLQMCAAVRATTDAHNTAWASFPSFATPYASFLTLLASADDAIALQEKSSTGTTEAKNTLRQKLAQKVIQLATALKQYATDTNNPQLRDDAYLSPSTIDKLSEKEMLGHAMKVKSLLPSPTPAVLSAAPFNITATFITDLNNLITSFNTAIGTPRHIIAESMRGTEDLERALELISEKLALMDTAADVLQYTQPVFYSEYTTSRIILDAGSYTRALTVTVVDAETNEPLQDAEAAISPSNIVKTTGAQGMFYVQSLSAGSYHLKVTKADYASQDIAFEMDNAGGIQLTVQLSR